MRFRLFSSAENPLEKQLQYLEELNKAYSRQKDSYLKLYRESEKTDYEGKNNNIYLHLKDYIQSTIELGDVLNKFISEEMIIRNSQVIGEIFQMYQNSLKYKKEIKILKQNWQIYSKKGLEEKLSVYFQGVLEINEFFIKIIHQMYEVHKNMINNSSINQRISVKNVNSINDLFLLKRKFVLSLLGFKELDEIKIEWQSFLENHQVRQIFAKILKQELFSEEDIVTSWQIYYNNIEEVINDE